MELYQIILLIFIASLIFFGFKGYINRTDPKLKDESHDFGSAAVERNIKSYCNGRN